MTHQDAPSTNGAPAAMYALRDAARQEALWRSLPLSGTMQDGFFATTKDVQPLTVAGANNAAGNQSYLASPSTATSTTNGDFAPQIRYAEVLLTLAEAEARNMLRAFQREPWRLLNAVQDRSLATPASQSYTAASFATKMIGLIGAILLERRIEFLGRRQTLERYLAPG